MSEGREDRCWRGMLSPLRLVLTGVNGVCFGGLLALLAVGARSGPLVLLTAAAGAMFLAGLIGAVVASRRMRSEIDAARGQAEP